MRTAAVVLAFALTASIVAAQPAAAQGTRDDDGVTELWREYPLGQTTTTRRSEAASEKGGPARERAPLPDEVSRNERVPMAVLLLAAALVVLGLGGAALQLVRRERKV